MFKTSSDIQTCLEEKKSAIIIKAFHERRSSPLRSTPTMTTNAILHIVPMILPENVWPRKFLSHSENLNTYVNIRKFSHTLTLYRFFWIMEWTNHTLACAFLTTYLRASCGSVEAVGGVRQSGTLYQLQFQTSCKERYSSRLIRRTEIC